MIPVLWGQKKVPVLSWLARVSDSPVSSSTRDPFSIYKVEGNTGRHMMNTSDLHTNTYTHTHVKTYVTPHVNTHMHSYITYTHICGGVGAYVFKALGFAYFNH